ncbi:MAG TPA: MCE family protein [Acidimicrobiales bacterium]|jgi:phospholipid/cholesterol/gamma-HCH transport system substrate-binding protein
MGRLADLARSSVARIVLVVVVLAAAVVVGIEVTEGPATYPLHVVYASAPGLFPGAAVDVLGVPVGTVTSVKNAGDKVDVGMLVNQNTKIPSDVVASLVAPQLLGQPNIDLGPGYTGGPTLAAGTTIAESHTEVPVSTDQVLKDVQRTLDALNPHAVGSLISNLATDLDGQGQNLNQLISSAAGTISLLANKGDDLGKLNGTLAQLTGTLDTDTSQIEQLVSEYDTVSGTIASHSTQLNNAITQLAQGSTSLVNLLVPNIQPLEADVGSLTTVGRTLDRNLDSVDEILQQGNNLFQGAARAYDPTYNWLDLNLELAPGVTGAYIEGLIRDRLSGICRRLVANHSTGLSATVIADLTSCGNPASNFFDPLLTTIPSILNTLNSNQAAQTTDDLLQKGLNQILAIQPDDGGVVNNSSKPPESSAGPTTTTTTAPTHAPTGSSTTTTTTPKSCGLVSSILGCKSPAGSAKPSGLGALLSTTATSSTATLASHSTPAASTSSNGSTLGLTAPDAHDLGPLPQDEHHATHHHRGLLAQWAHDVWNIF